jgi:hypothetical protein
LAEALEIAGARQENTSGPLLDEHFIAIEAVEAISKSGLGADSVIFLGKGRSSKSLVKKT